MRTFPTVTETSAPPTPPPVIQRRQLRWLLALLVLPLLAVGLLWVTTPGDDAEVGRPSTQLTLPGPSSVHPPPSLANTGAQPDWLTVARSITAYDAWLRANPDPTLVARYMHPSNPGYGEATDATRRLASGEWRYDPPPEPIPVESVRLMASDASSVRLAVRLGPFPHYHVIDREGRTVFDQPPGQPVTWAWVLRYDEGVWRLAKAEALS